MKFKPQERCKTRDGKDVLILHVFSDEFDVETPILGLIEDSIETEKWYPDGSWIEGTASTHDLIPNEITYVGYTNWYDAGGRLYADGFFATPDVAAKNASPGCVACTRIEAKRGQFDA